jgi:hypothetical protein
VLLVEGSGEVVQLGEHATVQRLQAALLRRWQVIRQTEGSKVRESLTQVPKVFLKGLGPG